MDTHQPHRSARGTVRRALVAAGLAATLGVASACSTTQPGTGATADAGSILDRIREEGSVNVGFANERPAAYRENGELVGADPAIHGYIFDQIGGIELEPHLFEFGSLIQALNAGRVDVVTAGMFITPERCQQASFSNPVYLATTALMVEAGNPGGLTDYRSVADSGAVLAVMNGAVEVEQARAYGIPDDRLQIVADQQSGLDAVKSGRADALALTSISLRALAQGDPGVEVAPAFVPVVNGEEQVGYPAAVFRQADTELRDAFNAELAELLQTDRWLELLEPYGITEAERPDRNLTAEEICQG